MIDLGIGIVLGAILFFTRKPLLAYYALNPTASALADQLIVIMSLVMVGMSYQMPVSHTQRKRGFQVHHEHESDQHMADRHAAFLRGCFLVEVADRGCGAVPAVRPDLQVRAGVSAI